MNLEKNIYAYVCVCVCIYKYIYLYIYIYISGSLVAQTVKNLPAMQ